MTSDPLRNRAPAVAFLQTSVCSFIVVVLIAMASLVPSQYAYSQAESPDTFALTLKNVDIRTLIETVSLRTGKNFIVDPRVKATVTVISAEPVQEEKLYALFLSILDVHGYAAVPAGNFTKIVPMSAGVQSAVPVLDEQAGSVDELITEVIQVENVPAGKIVESLRPLLPQTATIGAEANSNTITITDRAANITRLQEIIRLLDG